MRGCWVGWENREERTFICHSHAMLSARLTFKGSVGLNDGVAGNGRLDKGLRGPQGWVLYYLGEDP
jgi:hypothetical protein